MLTFYVLCKAFALPPATQGVLGVLGLLLRGRMPRTGTFLLVTAIVSLVALSMPAVGALGARELETISAIDVADAKKSGAEAIVVLGGGAYPHAPEFDGRDNVRVLTLERLRYAAHLQRATGLPIAVSGGLSPGLHDTEGELMRRALSEDFGLDVRWVEHASTNTFENALYSRDVVPVKRVLLVTHAMHMPRAAALFRRAGFEVVPAPMGFLGGVRGAPFITMDFVPTLHGLTVSHYVIYEALGALWYRIRYS